MEAEESRQRSTWWEVVGVLFVVGGCIWLMLTTAMWVVMYSLQPLWAFLGRRPYEIPPISQLLTAVMFVLGIHGAGQLIDPMMEDVLPESWYEYGVVRGIKAVYWVFVLFVVGVLALRFTFGIVDIVRVELSPNSVNGLPTGNGSLSSPIGTENK